MRTKPLQAYFTTRSGQDEELRRRLRNPGATQEARYGKSVCDGYSQCDGYTQNEKLNEYGNSVCDGYSSFSANFSVCQFVCQFENRICERDSIPLEVHAIHFVAV